jgi:hypothetical protein
MHLHFPSPLISHTYMQLVRLPLDLAGPDVRMVESLAPMWDEERQRCGGSLPEPPPEPPRTPQLLSHAVTAVRQEFQVRREG